MNGNIGDDLPPLVIGEITRAMIAEYSRVSKDPNPMHTDEALAQQFGYPTVYAQGMLGMGYLTRYLTALVGVDKLRQIKVRFKTMTWPGETITCRARVTEVKSEGGKRLLVCNVHTENQQQEPKVVGSATIEV